MAQQPERLFKPEVVAEVATGLVQREIILPNLIARDAEPYFQGSRGPRNDKVTIEVKQSLGDARELAWRDPSREIVEDELGYGTVDVELDTYLYKAVGLLREEQTFDIDDYTKDVLNPLIDSVAGTAEDRVASAISDADYQEEISIARKDRGTYNALIDARKFLVSKRVPRTNLVAVLGSEAEARALKDPTLVSVAESGSDSALRDATLGRIAGINLIASDAIDETAIYLFDPSAFQGAFRAPAPARSLAFSASYAAHGLSFSFWESHNSKNDSDRAFLGTFMGVTPFEDPVKATEPNGDTHFIRGVKLTGDDTDLVP